MCIAQFPYHGIHGVNAVTENEGWSKKFRPDIPSPARIYDYLLGGKDNYPADRAAAAEIARALPHIRVACEWNRAFLGRAVRHLAARGVRQFIDIGTGLPTVGNVHEIAQTAAPGAHVVYVDNDPVVLTHGRDLLHGVAGTAILEHDLRQPEAILADPELRALIDVGQPAALLLAAVLHFIPDEDDPAGIIATLLEPFPSGSYLVVSHMTADAKPEVLTAAQVYEQTTTPIYPRRRDQIRRLAKGLELVRPGLVWLPKWRPDPGSTPPPNPADAYLYALAARKP
jgi:S-adenosyl methyltransferase